jgi:DNA-directed RNA polymerase subunit RPC12/RpoP
MPSKQLPLFQLRPRARRVLMHPMQYLGVDRAGPPVRRFRCGRCGDETPWLSTDGMPRWERGIPCPACNKSAH